MLELDAIINAIDFDLIACVKFPPMLLVKLASIRKNQLILQKLEKIERKLDNLWKIKAEAGINHLVDGLNSSIENVKSHEFHVARQYFNELIFLEGDEVFYTNLNTIGYWGNYIYFYIYEDYKNALLQAYKCTSKYPLLSKFLFPNEIFTISFGVKSQDLSRLISFLEEIDFDIRDKIKELNKQFNIIDIIDIYNIRSNIKNAKNILSFSEKIDIKQYLKYLIDTIPFSGTCHNVIKSVKIVRELQNLSCEYEKYQELIEAECLNRINSLSEYNN